MRASATGLIFSATDLADFLDCEHLTTLGMKVLAGQLVRPYFPDPTREVLERRGREHEERHLKELHAGGGEVVEIELADAKDFTAWERAAAETTLALRRGVAVVYQGTFFQEGWSARPDFLVRVRRPSDLGAWSYEVVDTKLARHARARAIIQLCVYSEMLGRAQGLLPETMRLILGGDASVQEYRPDHYLAYVRALRGRFLDRCGRASDASLPEPVEHCDLCDFWAVCDAEWRTNDHLSLVAGISRHQRQRLVERGTNTLAALGALPLPPQPPIDGIGKPALARIREQARLQLQGRVQKALLHELMTPVTPECGLASLPPPSPGDIFFDIEGDPFAVDSGLEYLFGIVEEMRDPTAADAPFRALWALDSVGEKRAFRELIGFVMDRLERYPDMHIYHYAAYEPTALKKLMGRHGTCEDEVDRLLRGGVFVDLFRAVRQGVRASIESYSIKRLEPLYGFARAVDLKDATNSLRQFETYLGLGEGGGAADPNILRKIEAYNRDDCLSARQLRWWLEAQRMELERQTGNPLPRPHRPDPEPTETVREETARVLAVVERLTEGVPADPKARTDEQQGRWLLAQLLEWHRREEKSSWWEYYRLVELTDADLVEDSRALGGLEYVGEVGIVKKSTLHRYRFDPQEHDIRPGKDVRDPRTRGNPGDVHAVDDKAGTMDLKRGTRSEVPHPTAVIPYDLVRSKELKVSLLRIGTWVAEHGIDTEGLYRAARDLLLGRPPRVGAAPGARLLSDGEEELVAARRLVRALDCSVLPVQGPPGSGKTYTGARMIIELLCEGKKVGITANSHKVICKLLEEVLAAARHEGVGIRAIQKVKKEEEGHEDASVEVTEDNGRVVSALGEGSNLAAGTAWLWARPEMAGAVEVLFVDEAGQMSLANVVAVSPAASSLVLLGDPQQLDQPQKGVHPPGADTSALEHLLGDHVTIPADHGIFLARTRRMHPGVCDFVSAAFYEGRLGSLPELQRQELRGDGPLSGTGLRYVPVSHRGNQNESREEVEAVARLYGSLLDRRTLWVDRFGQERVVGPADVLVVAPYNAQVAALRACLGPSALVGTVDKFQGQEGAVVLYSMATSTADDAPRGMEFLFSLNRLNVAISRARCLAVLLASPALFQARCRTPRQIQLANALCGFLERATVIS